MSRSVAKEPNTEVPGFEDIFGFGCAVIVRTLVKMPDAVRLIVQGVSRFKIVEPLQEGPYLRAKIESIEEPLVSADSEELEALRRTVSALFERCVALSPQLPTNCALSPRPFKKQTSWRTSSPPHAVCPRRQTATTRTIDLGDAFVF